MRQHLNIFLVILALLMPSLTSGGLASAQSQECVTNDEYPGKAVTRPISKHVAVSASTGWGSYREFLYGDRHAKTRQQIDPETLAAIQETFDYLTNFIFGEEGPNVDLSDLRERARIPRRRTIVVPSLPLRIAPGAGKGETFGLKR